MPVSITCPECQSVASVPEDYVGRKVQCRVCRHRFVIPDDNMVNDHATPSPVPFVPPKSSPLTIVAALLFGLILFAGGLGLVYYSYSLLNPEGKSDKPITPLSTQAKAELLGKNPNEVQIDDPIARCSFRFPNKTESSTPDVQLPNNRKVQAKQWLCRTGLNYTLMHIPTGPVNDPANYLQQMVDFLLPEPMAATDILRVQATTYQGRPAVDIDVVIGKQEAAVRLVYANQSVYMVKIDGTRLLTMNDIVKQIFNSLLIR